MAPPSLISAGWQGDRTITDSYSYTVAHAGAIRSVRLSRNRPRSGAQKSFRDSADEGDPEPWRAGSFTAGLCDRNGAGGCGGGGWSGPANWSLSVHMTRASPELISWGAKKLLFPHWKLKSGEVDLTVMQVIVGRAQDARRGPVRPEGDIAARIRGP